jgi:hypothetical protein
MNAERARGAPDAVFGPFIIRHFAFIVAFQPGFVPEEQAASLAAIVGRPVAAQPLDKHHTVHTPQAETLDAGPVGPAKDAAALAAARHHFRHERQPGQLRVGVERGQDFFEAADGDGVTLTETRETLSMAALL